MKWLEDVVVQLKFLLENNEIDYLLLNHYLEVHLR